jgi:MFS family permease
MYYVPYLYYYFGNQMVEYFNTDLPTIASFVQVYGTVAFILYIPAGVVADMFGAKKLMVLSLAATSVLSLLYGMTTSVTVVKWITIGMAISTILTFWSAWLKSIARAGKPGESAKSFGLVYSMTGIFTVLFGTICTFIVGDDSSNLKWVLYFYAVVFALTAVLVQVVFPADNDDSLQGSGETQDKFEMSHVWKVAKMPVVWFIGLAAMSWYMFQSTTAAYNQYLPEVYDLTFKQTSFVSVWRTNGVIIFAGPAAIWLQSRVKQTTKAMNVLGVVAAILIALLILLPNQNTMAIPAIILVLAVAFMSLGSRSIYYGTVEEAKIPMKVVGTATGFISLIAYISDIFIHGIVARMITQDGVTYLPGFKNLFTLQYVLLAFAVVMTLLIYREVKKANRVQA